MAITGLVDRSTLQARIGTQVGEGTARTVFFDTESPGHVIKVSKSPSNFSNWMEWIVWDQIANEFGLNNLFGRCDAMSTCGTLLQMEKLLDVTTDEQRALRRYPSWMNDHKSTAWGVSASGEVKIRDYGMLAFGEDLAHARIDALPDTDVAMTGLIDLIRGMS